MTSLRWVARALATSVALLVASCGTTPSRPAGRSPEAVRAQLVTLIPASIPDRQGWAADIESAFRHIDVPPSTENLCAALAVIAQESTFVADPPVAGLGRIARAEIDRRAAEKHIPQFVVRTALKLKSSNGRSYADRIASVKTEKEMSYLFEEFVGKVPLGRKLFGRVNPVNTGGSMQVSIDFAKQYARSRGYPYESDSIRHAVFTREGGLYFGIAHLLDYPNSYERHLHRFADFNAGWYASRNAAFQNAVAIASGRKLSLDGDVILESAKIGETEAAVRSIASQLDLTDEEIRHALKQSDRHEFERTDLYAKVFEIAERKAGRGLPRAVVPSIRLKSPKITRPLTTEWFANRVQARYQDCVNRAFAARG